MPTVAQSKSSQSRPRLTKPENLMAQLCAAAEAKDEQAFLKIRQAIKWTTCSAAEFAMAVDWALMAGAHLAARQLASEGAARFPDHEELQKMACILAPPETKVMPGQLTTTWKTNREWLKQNWADFKGKWVALQNGQLLGVADSPQALAQMTGSVIGKDILVTPIW